MALELIDKQDNFEVIRDQIAAILVTEVANQMLLATTPADYKLRIYSERSNPWETYLNTVTDSSPLVNIWFDNINFMQDKSNIMERQAGRATYNVDCYGYAASEDISGGGHIAADEKAALEVQRAIRLTRNILMAAENTYLQARGLVWQRWIRDITVFQPPSITGNQVQRVQGGRIKLEVLFNEFSPQYTPEELELLTVTVQRDYDGQIILNTNYDYTA